MVKPKAILFDMHGTLVYVKDYVKEEEISNCLRSKGYEVSPQQWGAARAFVSFIDYPKYGYRNWHSYLSRVLWRLKVLVDNQTLDQLARLLESRPYQLYPDASEAVVKAKTYEFKTGIVTTIAHFQFREAIRPIRECFDFVMTGYEARCDKSNPKMYRKILEILEVKPQEAIMIGDDIELDILLPKRLGMRAVLLDRERHQNRQSVDAFVYDLNEAIEYILRS